MEANKTLVLLGNGPSQKQGIEIAKQKGCECWGTNFVADPCVTMLFQMHGDHFIRARFLKHYNSQPPKVPVIMHHKWPQVPTSVPFPWKQYRDVYTMRAYHACSMSYMLSLATMTERYNLVHVYGVDFYYELRHEGVYERPCFEWYMGFATARGISFDIPQNSRLMTTCDNLRQIYGLEWNPELTPDEYEKAYEGW